MESLGFLKVFLELFLPLLGRAAPLVIAGGLCAGFGLRLTGTWNLPYCGSSVIILCFFLFRQVIERYKAVVDFCQVVSDRTIDPAF